MAAAVADEATRAAEDDRRRAWSVAANQRSGWAVAAVASNRRSALAAAATTAAATDDGFRLAWPCAAARWRAVSHGYEHWRSATHTGVECRTDCALWAVLSSVLAQNVLMVQAASAQATGSSNLAQRAS